MHPGQPGVEAGALELARFRGPRGKGCGELRDSCAKLTVNGALSGHARGPPAT
ncbi:hypothetical protein Pd630_LPD04793 [Rhodococcus opacus PD630]|nr:hypothetical protein Pd630_LPD04793 [Rhodococcus opacus PD630]